MSVKPLDILHKLIERSNQTGQIQSCVDALARLLTVLYENDVLTLEDLCYILDIPPEWLQKESQHE